jgi:hypothetical protein
VAVYNHYKRIAHEDARKARAAGPDAPPGSGGLPGEGTPGGMGRGGPERSGPQPPSVHADLVGRQGPGPTHQLYPAAATGLETPVPDFDGSRGTSRWERYVPLSDCITRGAHGCRGKGNRRFTSSGVDLFVRIGQGYLPDLKVGRNSYGVFRLKTCGLTYVSALD